MFVTEGERNPDIHVWEGQEKPKKNNLLDRTEAGTGQLKAFPQPFRCLGVVLLTMAYALPHRASLPLAKGNCHRKLPCSYLPAYVLQCSTAGHAPKLRTDTLQISYSFHPTMRNLPTTLGGKNLSKGSFDSSGTGSHSAPQEHPSL